MKMDYPNYMPILDHFVDFIHSRTCFRTAKFIKDNNLEHLYGDFRIYFSDGVDHWRDQIAGPNGGTAFFYTPKYKLMIRCSDKNLSLFISSLHKAKTCPNPNSMQLEASYLATEVSFYVNLYEPDSLEVFSNKLLWATNAFHE